MRGADLPKSASAPAAARKPWRMGLVPRLTLRPGNGGERQHLPCRLLIIFMTLHLNSYKKMACAQPLYTVLMNTFSTKCHKVARKWHKVARKWYKVARKCLRPSAVQKLSLECQALVFPQFPLCDQRPLRKAEHTRGRRKSTQKRQEALFCDQIIPLPDPKRRVVAAAKPGEMPPEALFSDSCRLWVAETVFDGDELSEIASHRTRDTL